MSNNNKQNINNSKDEINNIQKKPFPNLLIPKKTWNIIRDKSKSSENLLDKGNYSQNKNQPIKMNPKFEKVIKHINLSENKFYRTNGGGFNKLSFKIKNFKKIYEEKEYTNKTNYLINENYQKKDIEQTLMLKIEEIKKELEKNENTFIYNQKIMQKKLEEKENEIIFLKNELYKEKNNKQNEYENIIKDNNIKFINAMNKFKKEIELLQIKNQDLNEQIFENEKIIKNLENKNRETILQLNDVNQKYNLLIEEKSKNILEDDIKQFINDLNLRIKEQQDEIFSLNEEMTFLNQENRRLKDLTKEIIESRNETEIFFLEALNEAKKDLYKIKKEKDKRGCFFPTLKNYYEISHTKVDIRELTPEMRERILRNLFEKINKGYNEKNYRELSNILKSDLSANEDN